VTAKGRPGPRDGGRKSIRDCVRLTKMYVIGLIKPLILAWPRGFADWHGTVPTRGLDGRDQRITHPFAGRAGHGKGTGRGRVGQANRPWAFRAWT
jgi:hypothetical protein